MTKEILLILPNLEKHIRVEKGIATSLITSFLGLTYEGISNYLHKKILQGVFGVMEMNVDLARNKVFT